MPSVSFIITTYNIETYIERCIESVVEAAAAANLGDFEVIIVDDGSTDDTVRIVDETIAFLSDDTPADFQPVYLGANSMGGVGIAANIGLDRANREWIFFVDGDDWVLPAGFAAACRDFERSGADIMLCDYREHDEANSKVVEPADAGRWDAVVANYSRVPSVELAIPMIAVPWRKFYRREFVEQHRLRFPEVDSFYEDNPFHWDVCMSAETIAFSRQVICHHRINRPGQTMAQQGTELLAFFDHYALILDSVRAKGPEHEAEATRWLLNQMSWTRHRIKPTLLPAYGDAAAAALGLCDPEVWDREIEPWLVGKALHAPVKLLRAGDSLTFISWAQSERTRDQMNQLSRELKAVREGNRDTDRRVRGLSAQVDRMAKAITKIENYEHAAWILGQQAPEQSGPVLAEHMTQEVTNV